MEINEIQKGLDTILNSYDKMNHTENNIKSLSKDLDTYIEVLTIKGVEQYIIEEIKKQKVNLLAEVNSKNAI